jgi:hypothetical protein
VQLSLTHALPGAWLDVADIERLRPDLPLRLENPNPEVYLEGDEATYGEALRAFRAKLIFDRLRHPGQQRVRGRRKPEDFRPYLLPVLDGCQTLSLKRGEKRPIVSGWPGRLRLWLQAHVDADRPSGHSRLVHNVACAYRVDSEYPKP